MFRLWLEANEAFNLFPFSSFACFKIPFYCFRLFALNLLDHKRYFKKNPTSVVFIYNVVYRYVNADLHDSALLEMLYEIRIF